MARYLAFSWPQDSEGADAQAARWGVVLSRSPGWRRLHAVPGLEVWSAAPRPPAVAAFGPGALVIGQILERRSATGALAARAMLPGLAGEPVRAARRLAADTWGAYVALLRDPRSAGQAWVFRDPTGALDALAWSNGDLSVVADDVTDLPSGFAPGALALDWDAITDVIRRPSSAYAACPLAGFRTVIPGELAALGPAAGPAIAIWRPIDHIGNAARPDAAMVLRQTVMDAVGALAAEEPRILCEVSGGLDSAIVAAALSAQGHGARVAVALNYYAARAESDERPWAQAICARSGFPLLAVEKRVGDVVARDFEELARMARPALNGLDAERDRDTARQAVAHGASAIFGGGGGDAVFFQMPSALVLEDLRRSQGRLPLGEPLVLDVARWLRRSTWRVRLDSRRGAAPDPDVVGASFWGPRARAPGRGVRHPWLADLEDAPPGKRLQIAALTAMQSGWGRSRRGDAARIQQPLLSQPVVEACLAIPAWQLVQGGRERGLARQAFAGDLPASVVERRGKGALTSLYSRRAAASLSFLRSHLMDGVLAEAGVLDRDRTGAALQADRLIWRSEGANLMRAAMVESWVRYWQGQAPDLATASRAHQRS